MAQLDDSWQQDPHKMFGKPGNNAKQTRCFQQPRGLTVNTWWILHHTLVSRCQIKTPRIQGQAPSRRTDDSSGVARNLLPAKPSRTDNFSDSPLGHTVSIVFNKECRIISVLQSDISLKATKSHRELEPNPVLRGLCAWLMKQKCG